MLALFVINSEFDPYLEFNKKKTSGRGGVGSNAILNRCIPYAYMRKSNPNRRQKNQRRGRGGGGFWKYVFLGYSSLFIIKNEWGFFSEISHWDLSSFFFVNFNWQNALLSYARIILHVLRRQKLFRTQIKTLSVELISKGKRKENLLI